MWHLGGPGEDCSPESDIWSFACVLLVWRLEFRSRTCSHLGGKHGWRILYFHSVRIVRTGALKWYYRTDSVLWPGKFGMEPARFGISTSPLRWCPSPLAVPVTPIPGTEELLTGWNLAVKDKSLDYLSITLRCFVYCFIQFQILILVFFCFCMHSFFFSLSL